MHDIIAPLIATISNGFIPRHNISASLSGWLDWNGDGVLDWVVTPDRIMETAPSRTDCLENSDYHVHMDRLPVVVMHALDGNFLLLILARAIDIFLLIFK